MSEKEGKVENFKFQAEVANVLDIVINSLYTHKEIFVRELISNASDALEKMRQVSLTEKEIYDKDLLAEIVIDLDEKNNTFTITDTGIGMTKDELIKNLGSIAHSGSKEFLSKLAEAAKKDINLIGQFGVGFYSAFIAASKVIVQTRSYYPDEQGYEWSSTGSNEYSITPKDGLRRGTKIILELKDDSKDYSKPNLIKQTVQKYSNFVPFTILINSEKINTVQALWARHKQDIKDEEYTEFFKFISNSIDDPIFHFHFSTDVPLQIYSLLFVPKTNIEQFGFRRYESGIDLHCKKVLIEKHVDWILPEWMRFVFGVIDSEDLKLNISRETLQESIEIKRLGKIITSRFIKFLNEQSAKSPDKFIDFYNNFGNFIKEGITTDFDNRKDLSTLIRFESSKTEPGKYTSLSEYVKRMKAKQKEIYYINGPSREAIEAGPYYELFKDKDVEVLYTREPVDDLALSHIAEFEGKKIMSGDSTDIDLNEIEDLSDKEAKTGEPLSYDKINDLCGWLKKTLDTKVDEVRESKRLKNSPAIIVNPDRLFSSSLQKVMQIMNKDYGTIGKKTLEINPSHIIIKGLSELKSNDEEFAKIIAEQIFDNALISAGLLYDPNSMLKRISTIIEKSLK